MTAQILEWHGYKVLKARDGQQALSLFEQHSAEIKVVITDILMPFMDGVELCRELRRRPEIESMKIIVLSAKSYDFDRRRARELGADGYIVKPINPATLLASIDEFVSKHMVVTYWGVRGTLPVPGPSTLKRGGNTSCVSIEVGGEPLYIFDCGTGIKQLSDQIMASGTQRFSAKIFISHTHWDHINTVPFFAPLYIRGNQVEIYGPYQGDLTIARAGSDLLCPVGMPIQTGLADQQFQAATKAG